MSIQDVEDFITRVSADLDLFRLLDELIPVGEADIPQSVTLWEGGAITV